MARCGKSPALLSSRVKTCARSLLVQGVFALVLVFFPTVATHAVAQTAGEPTPIETQAPDESGVADVTAPAAGTRSGVLPTNLLEIAQALGGWLIPFVVATLIALWFSTERLVVLRRGRVIPKPFVERFLSHLQDRTISKDEALQVCEENGSPVAMVFAHGVRKWGKPSVEVEQAIIDGGERQVASLRSHLRVINGVANITPLLGLLGTVWGMIDAFNATAVEGAMGNTTVLASGIALALLTTAAGLIVAIPSLIIYMYLSGRVDSLVMDMDDLAQSVVHSISAEALAERGPRKNKAAS